jgi:hypothetical protein
MPYTSSDMALPSAVDGEEFARADLRFVDIDHSGASFEGRVYLNHPEAGLQTPKDEAHGYVGSLYIFGHPHCWGDAGHCALPPGPLHGFDSRSPHHLVPQIHELEVTGPVRALIAGGATSATVTVVPVIREDSELQLDDSQLHFSELQLVSYE